MDSKYFSEMSVRVRAALSHDIPKKVGNQLVSAFKRNFREEGFFGEAWQDVRRRTHPRKGQSGKADSQRKILTGRTGNLGRSIQYKVDDGRVTVYSDLPYSAAHNVGTTTAGRGHKTTIPQRRFMGDHAQVRRIVRETVEKSLRKAVSGK